MNDEQRTYAAFAGARMVASGRLVDVLRGIKAHSERSRQRHPEAVLIFDEHTGEQVDFDLRGTLDEVLARIPEHPALAGEMNGSPQRKGPGRPKLGVVCREVCLLPHHWDWLAEQPGGASVFLRRLVQEASRREPGKQRARKLRDTVGRIMTALAGNAPNHEEAARALWGQQTARFEELVREWPTDVREYLVGRVREAERLQNEGERT